MFVKYMYRDSSGVIKEISVTNVLALITDDFKELSISKTNGIKKPPFKGKRFNTRSFNVDGKEFIALRTFMIQHPDFPVVNISAFVGNILYDRNRTWACLLPYVLKRGKRYYVQDGKFFDMFTDRNRQLNIFK